MNRRKTVKDCGAKASGGTNRIIDERAAKDCRLATHDSQRLDRRLGLRK